MTRQQRRFRAVVDEELARRRAGVNDGVRRILSLLQLLREEVAEVLADTPSEFDAAYLPRLLGEVNRAVEFGGAVIEDAALGLWDAAAKRGPLLFEAPLGAAGIELGGPVITRKLIVTLQDYSADKLAIALEDGRAAIEAHIRLGVLGGQSPHEVMKGIDAELGDHPGPYKRVSHRAEMIMRTETGRIHSTAAHARLQEAVQYVPDLGRQWLWSGKSRTAHAAVDGQKRAADEPFDVGGEKLMYPRDPAGSAENNVGCGCEAIPWLARWEQ